jgi:hypothetical protein
LDIPNLSFAIVAALAFGSVGALLRHLTANPEREGKKDIIVAHLVFAAIGFVVSFMVLGPMILPDGH